MVKVRLFQLVLSFVIVFSTMSTVIAATPAVKKVNGPLSVMVLGSGGPVPMTSGRASSGYLIFTDGNARVLMDVGGGTYQRLAMSGSKIKDLDLVIFSHLHIDHTADLSSFVKAMYFQSRGAGSQRTKPIRFFGPGENKATFPGTEIKQYPSTMTYIHNHYDKKDGMERYINLFAKAINGGSFAYEAHDVIPDVSQDIQTLISEDGLVIKAVAVVHGPVPSLAYRIEYKGKSLVFSGDTNSKTENMTKIANKADLLIYDTAIMDNIPNVEKDPKNALFYKLHTTPSRMGEVAKKADVKQLVLSHLTPNTESRTNKIVEVIRNKGYKGKIDVAQDLNVYNIK